ncbi:MAG: TetR/AcrR family transcriptional regulator [Desulfobacteraceae bacterium]|nr:MAG: TetR/AcrR family transcriptional regulator [Desulfobacteraceae bacterium]
MKNKKPLQQRKYSGVQADLRTGERKQKIIEAGLEAFGTIGYAKTSIKKICNLAGLTERYFYESFDCKEDLLSTVYQSIITELTAKTLELINRSEDRSAATAYASLKLYFQTLQEDPRKARMLFFEILGVSPRIDEEYRKAIQELSSHAMQILMMVFPALNYRQLKDTILPAAIAGAIIQVASQWSLNHFQPPLEKILSQVAYLLKMVEDFVAEQAGSS